MHAEHTDAEIEIRCKHLDRREESREIVSGQFSESPGARNEELIRLVTDRHPDARPKSFDGLVASFVSTSHLIIASFVDPEQFVFERADEPVSEQTDLFSDAA